MVEPKILKRLVKQLEDKGMEPGVAHAIATKQLQKAGDLKPGTTQPTRKGIVRGNMTPGERAKSRAAKVSGKSPSSYKYNAKTNRATLKR